MLFFSFFVYCLFVCLLFVCSSIDILLVFSSQLLCVGGGGISRLPVTRRRGSNNEKQQIHCQSIEPIGRTTLQYSTMVYKSIALKLSLR